MRKRREEKKTVNKNTSVGKEGGRGREREREHIF